jgi:hypothetical protein
MEIGLGLPAMTDMLTEDDFAHIFHDGLPDLDDCSLEWSPPDSTAALATEPASSPQLASRVAGQSVDLASPWPTAIVRRQARPAGHGGIGFDMCMLNSTYRLMGPCHTKLVETLSSYNTEDKESDYAHTIRHVEGLTGEKFVLQPPDDPANGSKKRSRLRESERRSPDGVNIFPFHVSQNRLCDEHRPLKRRRLILPAAASIVPAMPCAPIPILSAVPLGFAFVGAHGGGGVGGGTLCCGTPDGVALGGATPVYAFGGGGVGGGILSFGTSSGDALDSATPARAFGGCGGAFSGSMRGGNALNGEHREQSARSMEQLSLLKEWLEGIKPGYASRFAVAFEAAGIEDSDDLEHMDLGIYRVVEAALTQKCDAKPMHLKKIRLAIELLCGCGLEVPHTKQPTEASALAPSAPNHTPAKRDAKEPAVCLRVVCLSGHEMAYQVFKPTMNERHLNCDGEGCDAKIASGKYGWTCHTCHDFDLCDACADPSGRGRRSWSRRSSNRPQSPR